MGRSAPSRRALGPRDKHSLRHRLIGAGGRRWRRRQPSCPRTHLKSLRPAGSSVVCGNPRAVTARAEDGGAPARRAIRLAPAVPSLFLSSALSCATREPPLSSIWCGSGGRGARLSRSQLQRPGRLPPCRQGELSARLESGSHRHRREQALDQPADGRTPRPSADAGISRPGGAPRGVSAGADHIQCEPGIAGSDHFLPLRHPSYSPFFCPDGTPRALRPKPLRRSPHVV